MASAERRRKTAGGYGAALRRVLPVVVLVLGLAAFFAFDLHRVLTLDELARHRAEVTGWVAAHRAVALAAYGALYFVATAFSVPAGLFFTVVAGFLFGPVAGAILVVVSGTAGATVLFLAARHAFAAALRRRAAPWLRRLEAGFSENAFSYLLVLRLVPIFPFWLVNLVPAFLGVPRRTFVAATFLGVTPGSFVIALAGDGLGAVLDRGGDIDLRVIFEPRVLAALVGLALLALAPLAYRRLKQRGGSHGGPRA
jgi:uncharacterized membrane protein YdjX (TVP38/TMEM64 family)